MSFNVKNYGAVGNGTDDDTISIQLAIDAMIAECNTNSRADRLYFPAGTYKVTDELDFSMAQQGYYIAGDGSAASIIKPTSFGRTKKLFKCNHGSKENRVQRAPSFEGIRIQGDNAINADDPIGVYCPWLSTTTWRDFDIINLNNIAVYIEEADNCNWFGGELVGCGYQPMQKDAGQAVYYGATGSSISAYLDINGTPFIGVFTGMQGATLYLQDADNTVDSAPFSWAKTTIISVSSDGASCIISTNIPRTVAPTDGLKLAFGPITCTTIANNSTITLDYPNLSNADIGRHIFLLGCDSTVSCGVLHTTITAISGTAVTLLTPPVTSRSGIEVWLAPTMTCIHEKNNFLDKDTTNDLTFSQIRIENYNGPGAIFGNVTGVSLHQSKIHGLQENTSQFSRSRNNLIVSRPSSFEWNGNIEKGYVNGRGNIIICGNTINASIRGNIKPIPDDQYPVEFDFVSSASSLVWGIDLQSTSDDKYPILLKTNCSTILTNNQSIFNVIWDNAAWNSSVEAGGADKSLFPTSGSLRSALFYTIKFNIVQDNYRIYWPQTQHNLVLIDTIQANFRYGMGWFKFSTPSSAAQIFSDVSVVIGMAGVSSNNINPINFTGGRLHLLVTTDGALLVVNRTGAARIGTLTLFGGGQ